MTEGLHNVLRRQLERCFGRLEDVPKECLALVEMVSDAYRQADVDRQMLERSLELSGEELGDANGQLRQAVLDLQAAHRGMEARVIERTRELEGAHERLRQSAKMEAIGQLAGGVAHDFHNLLTVIGGCTDLLLAVGHLNDTDRVELDEIRKAAHRAGALTQQLLAFSRRQVLEPKIVDLNQIVLDLQTMLARLIREDITLVVDTTQGPAWVRVDPNQIEQVIINLVLNARDAMPAGGQIRLGVALAEPPGSELPVVSAAHAGEYVRLRVSDNGVGMSPEVRERVFEPFFTTKEQGKGTGLGLASVYGIVRQSNGVISVDTAEGVGTTFTMFFPMSAPAKPAGVAEGAESQARAERELVLLVEDEDAVRRVLRGMLEKHGYDVIEVATPANACTIFDQRARDIRLLVTDVVMPGMNGPALAQRLVGLQPQLAVLFISGYTDIDPMTLGLGHRNVGFLSKPISAARLAAKIRELFVTS